MELLKSKSVKAIFIAGLTLAMSILLIPISSLVDERNQRNEDTKAEVNQQWSGRQRLYGPYLKIRGQSTLTTPQASDANSGKLNSAVFTEHVFLSPSNLKIKGEITPQTRKRGIYEVILYDSALQIEGTFDLKNLPNDYFNKVDWTKTEVYFGISDMRGLNENVFITTKNGVHKLENTEEPELLKASLTSISEMNEQVNFTFDLKFRGSEHLEFIPNAANTQVELTSAWPNPSFFGNFLPTSHEITASGFQAKWNILEMNRNLPLLTKQLNTSPAVQLNTFGVQLIELNDNYQKNQRAVKYGVLIIALTFLGFFFSEVLTNNRLHIIQYGLVGAALIVFYCLLLSFSEIITFNPAYFISSVMTVGLNYLFCRGIFKNNKPPLIIALITSISYGFIFTIIQLEDTALLVGSLGLFSIIAVTMWVSRKVNWEIKD